MLIIVFIQTQLQFRDGLISIYKPFIFNQGTNVGVVSWIISQWCGLNHSSDHFKIQESV
jgi:hypothetical protein